MRRPDLHIAWLRGFIAVADHGSIAAAAAALSLSDEALRERLRRIEEGLGKPLFLYGTAGLRLSAEGGRLLDNARRLVLPHPSRGTLLLEAPIGKEMKAGFERFGFDEHEAEVEPFGAVPRPHGRAR